MAWNSLKALTVSSLETLIYWVIIGNLMFKVYFVMYFAVSYTTHNSMSFVQFQISTFKNLKISPKVTLPNIITMY